MILVDTSVWIEHFRSGNDKLKQMLDQQTVLTHPFVIGEIACGSLQNRTAILTDLRALPTATTLDYEDVLGFIENRKLWNRGLGWTDCHLLGSAVLSNCRIWTLDKALSNAALTLRLTG